MKIIDFSSAPTAPFWSLPAQALRPWISRIGHSLGHLAALQSVRAGPRRFTPPGTPASNDPVFSPRLGAAMALQPPRRAAQPWPSAALRVVREADAAISPDCAGRMIISGRMADVCAELDRMAERAEGAKP